MIPKHAENLPWRSIGERCVVIHPQRGEVHELDEVGSFLWRAIDGQSTIEQISVRLTEHFEVEAAQAAADTGEFLASLEALGLLTCPS